MAGGVAPLKGSGVTDCGRLVMSAKKMTVRNKGEAA
jgi:hypothetical protein